MSEASRISQLDLLRASMERLLTGGAEPDSPMIQGLRWQIASHERRARREASGGYFDAEGNLKPEYRNPFD